MDKNEIDAIEKLKLSNTHLSEYDLIRIFKVEEEFKKLKNEAQELVKKLSEFLNNDLPYDYNYSFSHAKGTGELLFSKLEELNKEVNFSIQHRKLKEEFKKLLGDKN